MDLSDNGDDFDNFFASTKSKKPTQKAPKFSDPMDDLFGIDDSNEARVPAPRKMTKKGLGAKSILAEEHGDDDDDLGFDPKKPKAGLSKSQNLFDDLLTPLETKRPQTAGPASKPPAISRQSTDTTTDTSNILQNQPRPKTSQGRRSSNMSNVQNTDPLGLFSKDKEATVVASSGMSTPNTRKKGTTADWLGLAVETEPEPEPEPEPPKSQMRSESPKPSKVPTKVSAEILLIPDVTEHYEESGDEVLNTEDTIKHLASQPPETFVLDSTAHNIMLMNNMNLEAKQSFTTLKYQEQHLMMATQMKQQEKVLMEMQHKQDKLLQHQERQFQTLLQQQMQRHHQLEDLIKHQQQRINTHLHLMMSQPPPPMQTNSAEFEATEDNAHDRNDQHTPDRQRHEEHLNRREMEKQSTLALIQIEADNKRLELENLRLEELVANTKSNYEREIELLEKSYKKQIEVLEQHLANLEKRLTSEIDELQVYFQRKIEVLEQEKTALKSTYAEDFSNLKQDHEDELRKLRKNQEEDLEMIKEEHRRMIDSIRQAKMLEFAAVQENGSYLECLKVASTNLTDLTGGLNELKENMQTKIDNLQLEREKKLEGREKRIEDAERRLKITEESNEAEKQRLMELVSTLELQMTRMSKETAEENWQLRQKLASIDAEKAAFAKEREFFREQMLRDEERIKELKEHQLSETQRIQAQLQVEKSKFDLEKRLHANTDTQKERMEVEAAMQVAQDAARKADTERERYYKMQRQFEQQKRDLADKEHGLNVKEEELHQELLSYRMAERVSQETQQKAKMAEQFYHNKIQMLQQRTQEISEKETNLSQERLLLAQDRIALHALKTKLSQQTKCSLCQLSQKNKEITDTLNTNIAGAYENPLGEFQVSNNRHDINLDFMGQGNAVERLLDANIADSLRKMKTSSNLMGWEMLLDDDHKKMVQTNNVVNTNDEYNPTKNSNITKHFS